MYHVCPTRWRQYHWCKIKLATSVRPSSRTHGFHVSKTSYMIGPPLFILESDCLKSIAMKSPCFLVVDDWWNRFKNKNVSHFLFKLKMLTLYHCIFYRLDIWHFSASSTRCSDRFLNSRPPYVRLQQEGISLDNCDCTGSINTRH